MAPTKSAKNLKRFDAPQAGFEALRRSQYDKAEALFRPLAQSDSETERRIAERGLALTLMKRGQFEQALELTHAVLSTKTQARAPEGALADLELGLVRAQIEQRLGRLGEALETLKDFDRPRSSEAHQKTAVPARAERVARIELDVLRGEILRELGQKHESRTAYERALLASSALEAESDAKRKDTSPSDESSGGPMGVRLARLMAEAAFALKKPEEAREAWEIAEERGGEAPDPRVLIGEALLFSERHNGPEAFRLLEKALEIAPHDPDVLTSAAELRLHELFAFAEASRLAERALAVDEGHGGALSVLAGVALRDLDFDAADSHLARGLRRNPRSLPLLSLVAARHFLAEEPEKFEQVVQQIEELSPGYAGVFGATAELGDFEHRFPDVIQLLRRGVQRDREDGALRAALGLALSRSGSEPAGTLELEKAFELDSYNRQVYNSLNLYQKVLPRDYEEFESGHFRFRVPKAERKLLERYVPTLVESAYSTYKERYRYEPPGLITVELYQDRQDFAVRTSGLPEVGLEGVCFGRKIATVSPRGGAANLGMTLWHEMAHVFHLGLSNNRVPRWLTEGLAEWETERLGRGWAREVDLDLYRGLRDQKLPDLGHMNRAFTRAGSVHDVGLAYAVAGRFAAFLSQEDEARTVRVLAELGQKAPLQAVLKTELGPDLSDVDERFRQVLTARLQRFEGQFVSLSTPPRRVGQVVRCSTADRVFSVSEVLELMSLGDPDCALTAEASLVALFAGRPEPESGLLLAELSYLRGQLDRAKDVLDLTLSLGADGSELRLERAKVASAQNRLEDARTDLKKTLDFDPTCTEAWLLLAQLELRAGQAEAELEVLRHLVDLEETNALIHERYLELVLRFHKRSEAGRAADSAIWAGLGRLSTHKATAEAYRLAGRTKDARFEEETVRLLEAGSPETSALDH